MKSYFYLNFKRKFAFLKRWSSIPSTTRVPFMWDSISGYKGFSDLDHSFDLIVGKTLTVRIFRIIIHFVGKYMFVARWYVSIFHNISSPTNWQTIKIKKPIYKNVSFSVRRHKNFEDILQAKFNVSEVFLHPHYRLRGRVSLASHKRIQHRPGCKINRIRISKGRRIVSLGHGWYWTYQVASANLYGGCS